MSDRDDEDEDGADAADGERECECDSWSDESVSESRPNRAMLSLTMVFCRKLSDSTLARLEL